MFCFLSQNSYEPGALLNLRAVITEYGVPLTKDTSVKAVIKMPDGTSTTVALIKVGTGIYELELKANYAGIYELVIHASGFTSRNVTFTREQVLTAGVWRGGDRPGPSSSSGNPDNNYVKDTICKLLHCLKDNINGAAKERLLKEGFNIDGFSKCFCS
jgi:hypothetical protein